MNGCYLLVLDSLLLPFDTVFPKSSRIEANSQQQKYLNSARLKKNSVKVPTTDCPVQANSNHSLTKFQWLVKQIKE